MKKQFYWVYILECENGSYYTGYTHDVLARYQAHQQGTAGCKYTRSFKPVRLAQTWKISTDKALAMRIERCIKKLSKTQKVKLIESPWLMATYLRSKL